VSIALYRGSKTRSGSHVPEEHRVQGEERNLHRFRGCSITRPSPILEVVGYLGFGSVVFDWHRA